VKKFLVVLYLLLLSFSVLSAGESRTVKGKVIDSESGEPLSGAVVSLEHLWSVTDSGGSFSFTGVQDGRYNIKVALLGYADYQLQIDVKKDIPLFTIRLKQSSLALKEVIVTSSRPKDGTGTSHRIGRDALNHLQIASVADMSSLLPGGKTVNPDLTESSTFSIRDGGMTSGNAAFSTAVEVDGVRLGNNASFSNPAGVDSRNISVDNIESVEVISGVPSAEYGDLGSGIVKIHTRHGRSPFNFSLSVNPRTWQASVSKGVGIGNGALNVSAEWARATKKLTSPYESYTRRGLNLNYSNTFAKVLRFEAGLSGNLGGMNSENDPDAFKGEYTKVKDNVLRGNVALTWLLNRSWISNLAFEASANYNDNRSLVHAYHSAASGLPAVHSEEKGYNFATILPSGIYFSDQVVDSRELDFAAALKYSWTKRFDGYKSALKAGLQWKSNGNAGEGEYYENAALAADGYRPRPYKNYPFMHNLALYAEEDFTFPFGLELTAGLRWENVFIKGSRYNSVSSLSPRFNVKYRINKILTIRGGWGVSEKLPSFFVLFPKQEYRDILVDSGTKDGQPYYQYFTVPYQIEYNPDLKWQRNENSELAVDIKALGMDISLVGFYNITKNPYKFDNKYTPVTVQRGSISDVTFVQSTVQSNGAPIYRSGAELTVDFPQIKPIRTSFRVDASYGHSRTEDRSPYYYYNANSSHTSISGRSYQYVGIYANGGNSNLTICGKTTDKLNANVTAITHIPEARIVISCRLELSLLTRSQNIPTGGKDVLYPTAYMTEDGKIHEFTVEDREKDEFKELVRRPSNDYTFDLDGYGVYAFANLTVTKEIGKKVSLSFYANNFTNSRPAVTAMATGVSAIFTPSFYYGLTCRIKL